MTTVYMYKKSGRWWGFKAGGHSNFDESGSDIVCAAVSALTQTALIGLSQVAKASLRHHVDQRRGQLNVVLSRKVEQGSLNQAQTILATLNAGLKQIAQDYPGHVRVICKEWREYPCSK